MITFSYQARDASGKIVSGIQDALNEDNAVTSLMSRGLMVLSLQKKAAANKTRKKTWSVKETDLVLFTRQLSTMIEAGISLVQALTALYDQCDSKRQKSLRHIISDVTTRVQGGETFNESIAKHPRVFDRLFVSMVKAGEHGGLLSEILDRPKEGFVLPANTWLRDARAPLVDEVLAEERLARHGLYDPAYVRALRARFAAGDDGLTFKVWTLVVFQLWYEEHGSAE